MDSNLPVIGVYALVRPNVVASPDFRDRVRHPRRKGLGRPHQHLCGQCEVRASGDRFASGRRDPHHFGFTFCAAQTLALYFSFH